MQEMTQDEVNDVGGAVTAGQILNYGAGVTAVGAAVLGGVAVVAGAPALAAGAAAYSLVSAGMWAYGAYQDMYA